MRIRKIEIQGFKSFVDRQTFHFGSGIAGVVGPNGCGKSNVVDAVKWCIGEQSAKSLRGSQMQDVIFNGSANRKPVGLAEVAITFAASGEPFPGEYQRFEEVQVGRRLFRDGTSEYLLNGNRVRRKDLLDFFLDTGVGNKLYSFIEQGQIGEIVNARPEQRRGLFEEAAGISRFKARKEEAELKLAETLQNLERAADVADEMGKRLRVLERQVEKAAHYRRLHARARLSEIFLGLARYAALAAERRSTSEQAQHASREAEIFTKDLERQDAQLRTRREEIQVMERVAGQLRDQLSEMEAQRREAESARHYQTKEATDLEARLQVLHHDAEDAQRVSSAARAEQEGATAELERERARLSTFDGEAARLLAEAEAQGRELIRVRAEVDRLKKDVMERITGLVQRRTRLGDLEQRRSELQERIDRLSAEGGAAEGQVAGLRHALGAAESEARRLEEEQQGAVAALDASRAGVGAADRGVEQARAELSRLERLVTEAERELVKVETRAQSLADLQKSHAGVEGGARAVLTKVGAVGVLAEQLDVPVEVEAALSAALGASLDQVILRSEDQLLEAARVAADFGRTVLVPPGGPEATGLAERVGGSPEGKAALSRLLGPVAEAPDLRAALELHRQTGQKVLTAAGELVLENGVVLAGKAGRSNASTILERRRELAGLQTEIERRKAIVEEHRLGARRGAEAVEGARRAAEAARASLDALQTRLRAAQEQVGEARLQARERGRELKAAEERGRFLGSERDKSRHSLGSLDAEGAAAREWIAQSEALQAELEERLKHSQSELVERERVTAQLRDSVARAQSERGSARERVIRLESAANAARARAEEAEKRLARADAERSKAKERVAVLRGDDARLAHKIQDLGERQGEAREQLASEKARLGKARESLAAAEEQLRGLRDRRDQATNRHSRLELRLQEIRLAIETLRDGVEGKYQVSLPGLLDRMDREAALVLEAGEGGRLVVPIPGVKLEDVPDLRVTPATLDDAALVASHASALQKFRAELDKLGEVNLGSLEEYVEVSERYAWLDAQRRDLQESVDSIRKTIAKINRTCRERFREAFDRVNANFQEIYPRLVGGGQSRLALTNEDDLLETGVEVFVQPPGKRLQILTLLSGGEKAMCAISLLFALFRVRPSPFCLLDEVDAPLDEGNGARFNDMLREMSAVTQFIVITHNKKTMEVADTLYGVTMPDPGTSTLVSVKVG